MAAWSGEKIVSLIELYEANPCLYDTKCKDYHNRDKKKKAVAEIASTLEMSGQ